MNCPVHDVPMRWETMTEEWSVEYCPECRENQYANLNDMERAARRVAFMERAARRVAFMKHMGIGIQPQTRTPML